MSNRVAVAIVHGVGIQGPDFAEPMIRELRKGFASELGMEEADAADQLHVESVHWATVLQKAQTKLWRQLTAGGDLDFVKLRMFMVDFAGDAIAYQPTPNDREVYDSVHAVLAEGLRALARTAGPKAPLCVVAHSLGTIIASNYFYDLSQSHRKGMVSKAVRDVKKRTPLEDGETLALFYTLGSPLAVWSLRYRDFGVPIPVPAPELEAHHPGAGGEWINFYDKDDVIGYPLRTLNASYKKAVAKDEEVNVGGLRSSWNPYSHMAYWTDDDVTKPIVSSLARLWRTINP